MSLEQLEKSKDKIRKWGPGTCYHGNTVYGINGIVCCDSGCGACDQYWNSDYQTKFWTCDSEEARMFSVEWDCARMEFFLARQVID